MSGSSVDCFQLYSFDAYHDYKKSFNTTMQDTTVEKDQYFLLLFLKIKRYENLGLQTSAINMTFVDACMF